MARKPRIHFVGAFYHVILRGNHGEQIFFSDKDRAYFYFLLEEGVNRFDHRIHAFCLMTNHIHLIIQVNEIPLSKIIQNLAFRYARWINNHKFYIGHLFQGRYKAILVDADNYILNLIRYIHLNPIKANLTDNLNFYHWSSHLAYTEKNTITWLTTDWMLGLFSNIREVARKQYSIFMQEKMNDSDKLLHEYCLIPEDKFLEKKLITKPIKKISISELISIVCDYFFINVEMLTGSSRQRSCSKARIAICLLAKEFNIANITSLAAHLKKDLSYFSRLQQFKKVEEEQDVLKIREILINKSRSQA